MKEKHITRPASTHEVPQSVETERRALSFVIQEPQRAGERLALLPDELFADLRALGVKHCMERAVAAGRPVTDCFELLPKDDNRQAFALFLTDLADLNLGKVQFDHTLAALQNLAAKRTGHGADFDRLATLDPLAYELARRQEAKRIGVRPAVLDAEVAKRRAPAGTPTPSGSTLDPWPDEVDGAELLDDIAGTYRRFCHLPPHAAEVLAAWVLMTYVYEAFDFAALVTVWSPEPECGKGRVLDVTEALARNPFRTANTSAAVLYHVVNRGGVTVLIDEVDSMSEQQREAMGNVLKSGFQSNGKASRMAEKNGEQVVVEFSTYSPKMTASISLDVLDKASRSRAIGIPMSRKPRGVTLDKFRRYDGTDIRRRCIRWAADSMDALKAHPAVPMDECASDRQEDVWEVLVIVAKVAGGPWEARVRAAAAAMSGKTTAAAAEAAGHQVLTAIRDYFRVTRATRVSSADLVSYLNDNIEVTIKGKVRPLSPTSLSGLLRPYGISSKDIRSGTDVLKGYQREVFADAFEVYLSAPPENEPPGRDTATTTANIGANALFEAATTETCSGSENAVSTNNDGPRSVVAAEQPTSTPVCDEELGF